MTGKIVGIAKATAAGAVLGGMIGAVCVPKKKKKRGMGIFDNFGNVLDIAGVAMQNFADIIRG